MIGDFGFWLWGRAVGRRQGARAAGGSDSADRAVADVRYKQAVRDSGYTVDEFDALTRRAFVLGAALTCGILLFVNFFLPEALTLPWGVVTFTLALLAGRASYNYNHPRSRQ